MKADVPQRGQVNARVWDKPSGVVSPGSSRPSSQGASDAVDVKAVVEKCDPPSPPSDIHKELTKLFRRL